MAKSLVKQYLTAASRRPRTYLEGSVGRSTPLTAAKKHFYYQKSSCQAVLDKPVLLTIKNNLVK